MTRSRRRGGPLRPGTQAQAARAALAEAEALVRQAQLDRAAGIVETVLAAHPRLAEAWHMRGVLALMRGHAAAASAALEQAVALRPGDAVAWMNLGIAEQQSGRPAAAEAGLRRAIALQPQLAQAHHNLGTVLKGRGELEAARGCFERAVACEADYANAWLELGRLHRDRGEPDEALACFAPAGDRAEAHEEAGLLERDRARYSRALGHLRAALRCQPGRAVAELALGYCLQETGAMDQALEVYRTALERDPGLYGAVVKNLTTAAKGRLWLRSEDLRRSLFGQPVA